MPDDAPGPPRLAALDGLRLIAALAVAVYHYTTFWSVDGVHNGSYWMPVASRFTVYGCLGVEAFFLISGFVIGMSSWGRKLGDYAVSRVSRLFPAYWVCIGLTVAVTLAFPIAGGFVPGNDSSTLTGALVNLTMLQEPLNVPSIDPVYWTLWIELRFYLLWAIVVVRGVTYRRAMLFCAVWMLGAVLATQADHPILTLLLVPQFAGYFIAGLLLYLMRRFGPSPLLWAMITLTWLVNLHQLSLRMLLKPGWTVPLFPAVVLITFVYLILIAVALGRTDRITWRWLTVAGALTYPYYLLHQRIGYVVIRHGVVDAGWPIEALVPATMALMLLPAWLVHRYVERVFGPRLRSALRTGVAQIRAADAPPAPTRYWRPAGDRVRWPTSVSPCRCGSYTPAVSATACSSPSCRAS